MDKKQELEKLVRSIPRAYDDFIENTLSDAEEFNAYDKLINLIKNTPDITPSDITKYRSMEFHGAVPISDMQ